MERHPHAAPLLGSPTAPLLPRVLTDALIKNFAKRACTTGVNVRRRLLGLELNRKGIAQRVDAVLADYAQKNKVVLLGDSPVGPLNPMALAAAEKTYYARQKDHRKARKEDENGDLLDMTREEAADYYESGCDFTPPGKTH